MSTRTRDIIYLQLKNETPEKLRELRRSYGVIKILIDIVGILGMIFASYLFAGMHLLSGSAAMFLIFLAVFIRYICTESIKVIGELLSVHT